MFLCWPEIKGYNEYQLSKPGHQDLYHTYPREIDEILIQKGYALPPENGGTMYQLPGYINGKPGVYGVKINSDGVIYHRHFMPLKKVNRMY